MTLSAAEQSFLARQPLGHLSTVGRDGVPQVKPVGFTYNPVTGTIQTKMSYVLQVDDLYVGCGVYKRLIERKTT